LLQAGASKAGKDFAAKHSEAMFLPGMIPKKTAAVVQDTRALLRELGKLAISGAHARAIGSPTTVANILQQWIEEAGVDGFNISYAHTPGTFEDIVKYLWPELKKRGVLQEKYAGSSMRENYLQDGKGPKVRDWHSASAYTWKGETPN
jgi:alkanesulfonate monooxygenase SsuD/methylene tetrahydromethanopterin reductase-like flavin-dependent oxidoreductase (luciferase family)